MKDSTVKISILLKLTEGFKVTPVKIPASILPEIDKLILNFIWKGDSSRIAKTIWKKKNKMDLDSVRRTYAIYKNRDSAVLTERQTKGTMKQNRVQKEIHTYMSNGTGMTGYPYTKKKCQLKLYTKINLK